MNVCMYAPTLILYILFVYEQPVQYNGVMNKEASPKGATPTHLFFHNDRFIKESHSAYTQRGSLCYRS